MTAKFRRHFWWGVWQGVDAECRTQPTDIKLKITALLPLKTSEKQKANTN